MHLPPDGGGVELAGNEKFALVHHHSVESLSLKSVNDDLVRQLQRELNSVIFVGAGLTGKFLLYSLR